MVKYSILLFFLLLGTTLKAQEKEGITYKIVKGSNSPEITKYRKAFESASWNCYRTKDHSRNIEFDNGIVFELYSAVQAQKNGAKIPTDCLTDYSQVAGKKPVYTLHSSGVILEGVPLINSSKKAKELRNQHK